MRAEVEPVGEEDVAADLDAPMPAWAVVAMVLGAVVLAVPYALYLVR